MREGTEVQRYNIGILRSGGNLPPWDIAYTRNTAVYVSKDALTP